MLVIVTWMNKIELIYIATVFVFLLSPIVFCKLPSKVFSNYSLNKCHDSPSLE